MALNILHQVGEGKPCDFEIKTAEQDDAMLNDEPNVLVQLQKSYSFPFVEPLTLTFSSEFPRLRTVSCVRLMTNHLSHPNTVSRRYDSEIAGLYNVNEDWQRVSLSGAILAEGSDLLLTQGQPVLPFLTGT